MAVGSSYRGWAGRSYGWRYYAQRLDGSGSPGVFLHNELRLQNVTITEPLSGPAQLQASIFPVDMTVKNPVTYEDDPLILPERGTLIHAELNGDITHSFLLMGIGMSGPEVAIDGSGVTTIGKNISYPTSIQFIEADPVDIIRHIWFTIQSDPEANIGLTVNSSLKTDIRIGKAAVVVPDTTPGSGSTTPTTGSADADPFELNWWSTHDLGGEIDKLCSEHGIQYRVRSKWNVDKTNVTHHLELGYPTLGIRRTQARFVVGENIQTMPDLSRDADEYANHVVVLGAGEGSMMVRGEARHADGRVHTMVTLDDKSLTDAAQANRLASIELQRRQQLTQISDIVIRNTGLAPYGSFAPGDEIRVSGMTDWESFDLWARVNSLTITPDEPDFMKASIARSDWY